MTQILTLMTLIFQSNKISLVKNVYKYFIGHKDSKTVIQLCIKAYKHHWIHKKG